MAVKPRTSVPLGRFLVDLPGLRVDDARVDTASGPADPDQLPIVAVTPDSRAVTPGTLFVAVRGESSDGHAFVGAALAAGAVAVVLERGAPAAEEVARQARAGGAVVLWHPSTRVALAGLAASYHGRPAERLRLCGVTGTNGKTTTTYLVEEILRTAGRRPAVIGTVRHRFAPAGEPPRSWPAAHTTPDPLTLHALFAELVALGATDVIMEVSSHALVQERVAGLSFAASGFSNLTRDHLDFHGSMEAYYAAKRRLFLEHGTGPAVLNVDDPAGARLADELRAAGRPVLTVSTGAVSTADVRVLHAALEPSGTRARLAIPGGEVELRSPLVGDFNLANLALAVGLGIGLGVEPGAIAAGLARTSGAPGRLERIDDPRGVLVLVDYAHTPDALERALGAVRPLCGPGARLLCVMGCGGERDPGKRPLMGEVAARLSDLLVVTSDNPRREDPGAIVDGILPGVVRTGLPPVSGVDELGRAGRGYLIEVDRRTAILAAVSAARPGDVLLIAGKGHEDYQIVGTEKRPFDDREVAREGARLALANGAPAATAATPAKVAS